MNYSLDEMHCSILVNISKKEHPNAPPSIILEKKDIIIGRHGDVKMDTASGHEISKKHASITFSCRSWVITDLSSLNGTFVNGHKVIKHKLKHKDEIIFGYSPNLSFGDTIHHPELCELYYKCILSEAKVTFHHCTDLHTVFNTLEGENICPICFSPVLNTFTLPCKHSFCHTCITEWVGFCLKEHTQIMCPCCRNPFDRFLVGPKDISPHKDIIFVYSIAPVLRLLKINCFDELNRLKAVVPWGPKEKSDFWNSMTILSEDPNLKHIVKAYLGFSYAQVVKYDEDQLKCFITNLDGSLETKFPFKETALALLALKVNEIRPSKNKKKIKPNSFSF